MLNDGKLTARSRGQKKVDTEEELKHERKRFVTSFQKESLDVIQGYRAVKFDEWVAQSPNKVPQSEGRVVRVFPWPLTGVFGFASPSTPLCPRPPSAPHSICSMPFHCIANFLYLCRFDPARAVSLRCNLLGGRVFGAVLGRHRATPHLFPPCDAAPAAPRRAPRRIPPA